MNSTCIFCKSGDIEMLEKISYKDLVYLYKLYLKCDISSLVKDDISYMHCRNCDVRFYLPTITGDEKFYNALQKYDWYYADEKEEFRIAKRYISETDKVLEVGSGKGAFAAHLPTKEYVGLDFSENAKEMAAKNGIKIENETIQNFAETHEEVFDVIATFQVLEHIADPNAFIKAKIKALKRGGKMIIAVPCEDSFMKIVTNGILNMPPHHVTRWSDKSLQYVAEVYNMDLLCIQYERMQENQKIWFLSTMLQSLLLKSKLTDLSFQRSIVSKLSNLLAIRLARKLEKEAYPSGYTVVAVYRKK